MEPSEKQTQIINILKALNVSEEDIIKIMVIVDDTGQDEFDLGYNAGLSDD